MGLSTHLFICPSTPQSTSIGGHQKPQAVPHDKDPGLAVRGLPTDREGEMDQVRASYDMPWIIANEQIGLHSAWY